MSSAEEGRDKPGIGCKTELGSVSLKDALRFSGARSAGQGLRPVDPDDARGSILGIRLSGDLRSALATRATAERLSASCLVRRLLADHLAVEGTRDREDGSRFVDEDVERACRLMDGVGQLVMAARDLPDGSSIAGVLGALESAHLRIVRMIERAEAVKRASTPRAAVCAASNGGTR